MREELIEAWCKYRGKCSSDNVIALDFAHEYIIKKACEWLEKQSCCGYIEDVDVNDFVEQFKQAMYDESK